MDERTTADSHERRRVIAAEMALWTSAAAQDQHRLEWLLHDDFSAITCDGVLVARESVARSTARGVPVGDRVFSDWVFHEIPWPLLLVTYHLTDADGCGRHMSVWDVSTGSARIRFHQGTWVADENAAPTTVFAAGAL